jgi:hypothetical protein
MVEVYPYAVCDICGRAFEPRLQDSEGDMFFMCPRCDAIYHVTKKDTTTCHWCGKVVDGVALEFGGKPYCSKDCYDEESCWYSSNGEIRE